MGHDEHFHSHEGHPHKGYSHEHGEDCGCPLCRGASAADDPAALSVRLTAGGAYPPGEWERRMTVLFERLFPYLEADGVAIGHLKGAVRQGDDCLFLSKTLQEGIDLHASAQWGQRELVERPVVTVNLISVLPVPLTGGQLEAMVREALSAG